MAKGQATPQEASKAIEAPQDTEQKQVATVAQGGAAALPADMADFLLEDAGAGLEKVTKDELAIPRLALLQALSDQCKKTNTAYIPEARPGDWYDSVLDKLYPGDVGLDIVFVDFRPTILEWFQRNNPAGNGFVADHGNKTELLGTCTRGPKGEFIPPTNPNTELVPTKEYFAFLVDKSTGSWWPILTSFAKSQVKHANKLNTLLTQRKIEVPDSANPGSTRKVVPPIFYHLWHCTTVPETNKNGDEWMGWDIQPGQDVLTLPFGKELYLAARAYKSKVDSGKVNVAAPVGGGADHGDANDANDANEKVPF